MCLLFIEEEREKKKRLEIDSTVYYKEPSYKRCIERERAERQGPRSGKSVGGERHSEAQIK
jgi:hypothetical protein